jgi:hypothetical protein
MSDSTSHPPTVKAPPAVWWVSTKVILWTLAGFLLFALGAVKLLENTAKTPSEEAKRVIERQEILAKIKAEDVPKLETYAVLDPATKKVRLPIDRAMELTVNELAQKPIKPLSPLPPAMVPAATSTSGKAN